MYPAVAAVVMILISLGVPVGGGSPLVLLFVVSWAARSNRHLLLSSGVPIAVWMPNNKTWW